MEIKEIRNLSIGSLFLNPHKYYEREWILVCNIIIIPILLDDLSPNYIVIGESRRSGKRYIKSYKPTFCVYTKEYKYKTRTVDKINNYYNHIHLTL